MLHLPSRDRTDVLSLAVLVAAAVFALAVVADRFDFVPLWDGRIYADCVLDAARAPFAFEALRCAGHLSHGYVLWLWAAQRLAGAPDAIWPLQLANLALLGLAALALGRILGRVLPPDAQPGERRVAVALLLVHPVALASVVQPGLDLGVMVFALVALACLLEARWWGAGIAGTLLVFSKEPGVLVYAAIVAARLVAVDVPRPWRLGALRGLLVAAVAAMLVVRETWWEAHALPLALLAAIAGFWLARPRRALGREELRGFVGRIRRAAPLLLPVVVTAGYFLARRLVASSRPGAGVVVWGGGGGIGRLLLELASFDVTSAARLNAVALAVVLSFQWIPAIVAVAGAARWLLRRRAHFHRSTAETTARAEAAVALVGATLALFWLLTRYQTYSNARYYLPLHPLVIALGMLGLSALVRDGRRRALLALPLVPLLALSALRTVDPVSRNFWGTASLGERSVLRVTWWTDECCGAGRDQLGYNLQFTAFDEAQSRLYALLPPPDSARPWLVDPGADWFAVGPLDAATRARTLRRTGTVEPDVRRAFTAARGGRVVREGWYIRFPNMYDSAAIAALERTHELGAPRRATVDGVTMTAWPVRLRSGLPDSLLTLPRPRSPASRTR